jgi:peptidyl-tRNA hydrolase
MNENLYLYILMRNDLGSLGPGRAAAQASHAANAFIHKFGGKTDVKEWQKQTPQGFGTAIVLGVNMEQLKQKLSEATHRGFFTEMVVDPDYVISVSKEIMPFIDNKNLGHFEPSPTDPTKYLLHREEVTCGYIFGDKEKLVELLGDLPLYS